MMTGGISHKLLVTADRGVDHIGLRARSVFRKPYRTLREIWLVFVLRTTRSNIRQTLLAPFHFATLTQNISLNH